MEKEALTTWFQYRDPLIGVLDYIAEVRPPEHGRSRLMYSAGQKKCIEDAIAEDIIAIAHDDDLQLIEDVVSSKSKCRIDTTKLTSNART